MTKKLSVESSPLLRRMQAALDAHPVERRVLRVSVAKEVKWESSPKGDQVLVRWLCWNICSGEEEITPPEFEVVGEEVTSELMAKELPTFFNDVNVIVDNDIDV